jgi:TPP-dependent pyruvate/acetoin dehydrogenase alpha subunit
MTEAQAEAIGQEEELAIEEGIRFAEASPLPETDILLTDVYAEGE